MVVLAAVDWSSLFLCCWVSLRYQRCFRLSRPVLGAVLSRHPHDFLWVRLLVSCQWAEPGMRGHYLSVSWRRLYVTSAVFHLSLLITSSFTKSEFRHSVLHDVPLCHQEGSLSLQLFNVMSKQMTSSSVIKPWGLFMSLCQSSHKPEPLDLNASGSRESWHVYMVH